MQIYQYNNLKWRETYMEFCNNLAKGEMTHDGWFRHQKKMLREGKLPEERNQLLSSVLGGDWADLNAIGLRNSLREGNPEVETWKNNTHALGKEVWYTSYDSVFSGMIVPSEPGNETDTYLKLSGTRGDYGTVHKKPEECYESKEALLAAMRQKSDDRTADMAAGIQTVNDLVRFMYDNNVSPAEEYTDWDARAAAREAAKRLLGIDLEEPVSVQNELDASDTNEVSAREDLGLTEEDLSFATEASMSK